MNNFFFNLGLFNFFFIIPLSYIFTSEYSLYLVQNLNQIYLFIFIFFNFFLFYGYQFIKKNNFFFKIINIIIKNLFNLVLILILINILEDYLQPYSKIHYLLYFLFLLIFFLLIKLDYKNYRNFFNGFSIIIIVFSFTIVNIYSQENNNRSIKKSFNNIKLPNIIIYIADGISGDFFKEKYENTSIFYNYPNKILKNFSIYENHISNYDITDLSLLSLLSGNNLKNKEKFLNEMGKYYNIFIRSPVELCSRLKIYETYNSNCINNSLLKSNINKKQLIFEVIINTLKPFLFGKKKDILIKNFINKNNFNEISKEYLNDPFIYYLKNFEEPYFMVYFEGSGWLKKLDGNMAPGKHNLNKIKNLQKNYIENELDKTLKSLISFLFLKKKLDSSMIIFTSDHGFKITNFKRDNDYLFSNSDNNLILNTNETRVPLFLKFPGLQNKLVKKNTSHADISNTIMSYLNNNYDTKFNLLDYGIDITNIKLDRFIEYRQTHYEKNSLCLDTSNLSVYKTKEFNSYEGENNFYCNSN